MRQNATLTGIAELLGLKSKDFTFANPQLISAPFASVVSLSGSTRKLPDPSNVLGPAFGIERVIVEAIKLVPDERGPSNELVYKPQNDDQERIRFYGGPWVNVMNTDGHQIINNTASLNSGIIEITFFGTGLNMLDALATGAGYEDFTVTVDGVAGTNVTNPANGSNILNNRNSPAYRVSQLVKGLTLGLHTVRIGCGRVKVQGFEILNETASIAVSKGEIISGGSKLTLAANTTTPYNSGFDGSPILNGRGGNVVMYARPNGTIGKVIQQADDSALFLAAADHANEERIVTYNFREFGAGRSDDFSTLSTSVSDRGFTLDDGTTTLVGDGTRTFSGEHLQINDTAGFVTITFVGTGLDIVDRFFAATSQTFTVFVDGVSVGTFNNATGITNLSIRKICSGLPYGTHSVRIQFTAGSLSGDHAMTDFIVYGPKRPAIPDGAVEIGQYYLMANYSGANITGTTVADWQQVPQGSLLKAPAREYYYQGASWVLSALNINVPYGFEGNILTNNGQPFSLTFFGTGIVIGMDSAGAGLPAWSVTIDGALNATGVARSNVTNSGGGIYTNTSTSTNAPARVEFTGLSLGVHTVTVQRTGGTSNLNFGACYVITPIHVPNSKAGSMALNRTAKVLAKTGDAQFDKSKCKAWLVYDGVNGVIMDSYNIAAVVRDSAGVYRVFFNTPFKTANYSSVVWTDQANSDGQIAYYANYFVIQTKNTSFTLTDDDRISVACFGELANE